MAFVLGSWKTHRSQPIRFGLLPLRKAKAQMFPVYLFFSFYVSRTERDEKNTNELMLFVYSGRVRTERDGGNRGETSICETEDS